MSRCELLNANFMRPLLLGLMALGTGGGCWQEIEYTGTFRADATQQVASPTPQETAPAEQVIEPPAPSETASSSVESDAANFGEDLAESLPDTSATVDDGEPVAEEIAAEAIEDEASASAAEVDPYAMPVAEASANYASADSQEDTEPASADEPLNSEATDVPTATEPRDKVANIELAAWQLGSKLSLATLAHDRGVAADNVQQWLAACKSLAASLGTASSELPEPGAADNSRSVSQQAIAFLLAQGQRIGRDLARQHSARHPALFEVAMKSNLLRVMYEPGSTTTEKLSASLTGAAKRAELPAELLQPLLDTLSTNADIAEVRKAVQQLHADVERHLAEDVER